MSTDEPFEFLQGNLPLLVSVPHDGRTLPPAIAADMTPAALALPDTDWHVGRLYGFCRTLGASLLVSGVSRYVVDLNRPATRACTRVAYRQAFARSKALPANLFIAKAFD